MFACSHCRERNVKRSIFLKRIWHESPTYDFFFFFLVNTPFYSLSALLLSPPPPTAAHCELRHLKARHNDQQSTALACLDSSQIFFFFSFPQSRSLHAMHGKPLALLCADQTEVWTVLQKRLKTNTSPSSLCRPGSVSTFYESQKKYKIRNFVNIYTHYCTKHMHTHTLSNTE